MAEAIVAWVAATLAISTAAAELLLIVAALTLAHAALPKKPKFDLPSIAQQRQFTQQPFSPRQVFYGTAWFAPKIVYSGNHGTHSDGKPSSYMLLCALCDHGVGQVEEIHVSGQPFFTQSELSKFGDFRATDGTFVRPPLYRRNTVPNYPSTQVVGENGEFNFTIDRGASDADFPVTHKNPDGKLPEGRKDAERRHSEQGFTWMMRLAGSLTAGSSFSQWAGNQAIAAPPVDFQTWEQTQMHLWGTAHFAIIFPIASDKTKEPLWSAPPNILMKVSRPRSSLELWDDSVAGTPLINPDWTADNAALCCYDYLIRYTDYGVSVCGYSRIDLDSVARAAKYCHENKLYANGSLNLASSPSAVREAFEEAMGGGTMIERNGVIEIHAGRSAPALYSYDMDDIVEGSWSIVPTPPRAARRAVQSVAYVDTDGERQEVAFHHGLAEENLKVEQRELLLVNNEEQARRVAWVDNARSWDTTSVLFRLMPGAPVPKAFDRAKVNFDQLGLSGTFRVMEVVENAQDGTFELSLRSERDDLFDVPPVGDYVPPPQPIVGGSRAAGDLLVLEYDSDNQPVYVKMSADDRVRIN